MSFRFLKSFSNHNRFSNDGNNGNHRTSSSIGNPASRDGTSTAGSNHGFSRNHSNNKAAVTLSVATTKTATATGKHHGFMHSGRDRGPGGQVLIHRTVQSQQPKQQQQRAVVTPKQNVTVETNSRQEIQGVLSMEEVMKDLRILEEQQHESQRKLQSARMAKQRAERQHTKLESKLGELKFVNGQSRALLHRMHEVLAGSHKTVKTMRNKVDDADKDLHTFNRGLQEAMQTKVSIILSGKKQQRQLERVQATVLHLESRKEQIKCRKLEAERRLEQIMNRKQVLLDGINKETLKQQKVTLDISEHNSTVTAMEQTLQEMQRAGNEVMNELDHLKEENNEFISRSDEELAQTEGDICKKRAECKEAHDLLSERNEDVNKEELDLKAACERHIASCESNEIPFLVEEKDIPLWDKKAADSLLETEETAIKEEEEAKISLEQENQELKSLLASLRQEAEELETKSAKLRQAEKNGLEAELRREEGTKQLLQQFEAERNETNALIKRSEELKTLQEKQEAEDNETAQKLAKEAEQLEQENKEAESVNHGLQLQIEECEKKHGHDVDEKDKSIAEKEDQISRDKELLAKITAESDTIEAGESSLADLVTIENEIAGIIEEWPVLESIVFTYEPDKSIEDQAKVDLALIMEDCKKREKSARKLHREQERVKRREEKERRKIEKERELEAQRRERARERRKQRHEEKRNPNRETIDLPEDEKQRQREKHERKNVEVKPSSPKGICNDKEISAAKPRNLLCHFSQASEEHCELLSSKKTVRWNEEGLIQSNTSDENRKAATTVNTNLVDTQDSIRMESESKRSTTSDPSYEKSRALLQNTEKKSRPMPKKDESKPHDALQSMDRLELNVTKSKHKVENNMKSRPDKESNAVKKQAKPNTDPHDQTAKHSSRAENATSKDDLRVARDARQKRPTKPDHNPGEEKNDRGKLKSKSHKISTGTTQRDEMKLEALHSDKKNQAAARSTRRPNEEATKHQRGKEITRPKEATSQNADIRSSNKEQHRSEAKKSFESLRTRQVDGEKETVVRKRSHQSERPTQDGASKTNDRKDPVVPNKKRSRQSEKPIEDGISKLQGKMEALVPSRKRSHQREKPTENGISKLQGKMETVIPSRKRSHQSEKPIEAKASKLQRRLKTSKVATQNKKRGLDPLGDDLAFDFHF